MLIPLWAKALIVAGIVAAGYFGWQYIRADIRQEGYEARTADYEKAIAAATIARQAEARAIEIAMDARLYAVAETYQQEKRDAELESARVADGLRTGAQRLRDHWQGCIATAGLSADAASRSLADALKREREESAGRIVAAARACDAQVRGLQSAIRVMQGAGQ